MTVQHARRTAVASRPATRHLLPEQRHAEHDRVAEVTQPPAAPPLRGWGSTEDRTMARWLMVMAVALGLYVALFITLGTRVWG